MANHEQWSNDGRGISGAALDVVYQTAEEKIAAGQKVEVTATPGVDKFDVVEVTQDGTTSTILVNRNDQQSE